MTSMRLYGRLFGFALVALLFSPVVARFLLTATAAERWYPPVQALDDPVRTVTGLVAYSALVCVLVGLFGLMRAISRHKRRERVSWSDEVERLRRHFARALESSGMDYDEALAKLDAPFEDREDRVLRLPLLARDPQRRRGISAFRVVVRDDPRMASLGWDIRLEPDDLYLHWLRDHYWGGVLKSLRRQHAGLEEFTVHVPVPAGMTANAVAAMRQYLVDHSMPGLVVPALTSIARSEAPTAPLVSRREWYQPYDGDRMAIVVYLDPQDRKRLDVTAATLTLVSAASPLARIPHSTTHQALQEVRALLMHWCDVLSLQGYAPEEFREHPDFDGIVEPDQLARWALREVLLDLEPVGVLS